MAASPRTLEDALRGGKTILGEGAAVLRGAEGNSALMNKLRQAAMRVDPVIDAAAINAGMPDDAINKAAKKHAQRQEVAPATVNALLNATEMARQNQYGSLTFVGSEEQLKQQQEKMRPVSRLPAQSGGGLDGAIQSAESIFGYAAFAPIATEMALPALGGVAGFLKMDGLKNTLNAPSKFLNETHITKNVTARQAMNDGVQIGFTAFQTYGVAKGFTQNMAALKEMYADVTGKDANSISTMGMLTATGLPPMIAQARDHFVKEYGSRGLLQVVGWGLMARDLLKGKPKTLEQAEKIATGRIGMVSGILPGIAGIAVDMFMGTSTTEVYSGFKKAFETGQPIPGNEYAAFILASNPDLAKRKVGKQVATEIGEQYANEKVSPGEILRQMNDGRFKARIEQLIAKDEAEAAQKGASAPQKPQSVAHTKQSAMVDKAAGAKQEHPVIGKFTEMVKSNRLYSEDIGQRM